MPETETWTYTLTIPNDPRAVPVSRHTLRLVLKAHGLPHLAEAAELVATELIANAVQHTKGPACLRMQWAGSVLRIGVWDTDPTPPPRSGTPPGTTPRAEGSGSGSYGSVPTGGGGARGGGRTRGGASSCGASWRGPRLEGNAQRNASMARTISARASAPAKRWPGSWITRERSTRA